MEPTDVSLLLAGAGGSLVVSFIRPLTPWYRALANIALGTIIAWALTPAFCEWREIKSPHGVHAAAFGAGLLGMIFCRAIVSSAESDAAKQVGAFATATIQRIIGGKQS